MADENQELTDDEQFAQLTKGNPLFDENASSESEDTPKPDDAGGDEEKQEQGPEATDEPSQGDADTPAKEAPSDEPFPGYDGLSEEAKSAYSKLADEAAKFDNNYKALHGITAPLQRQNEELRRQMQAQTARIQQLEQVERKQQDVSVAKDKALQEYDVWAKQFPEESHAFQALVNPLREKVTALEGSLNTARAELGDLHTERQQAALKREFDILGAAHPDWQEIHGGTEYPDWLAAQPPGIQALDQSMFAGDAIALLNLFKSSHAPAQSATPTPAATNADAVQQRRTKNLQRGTQPEVHTSESAVRGGNQPALTDEDAQFASLVAGNPNFR